MENKTSKTVETKALNIADVRRSAGLLKRNFKYETKSKIQMEW